MDNDSYAKDNKNYFDKLIVNVPELYSQYPPKDSSKNTFDIRKTIFSKIYRSRFFTLKIRNYLFHFFRRINLDLTWLDEFKFYWQGCLKGRPFWSSHDFFFLKNLYRVKFQNNEVPKEIDSSKDHLDSWQKPEVLYQLLHLVAKESVHNEIKIIKLLKKYRKIKDLNIIEFGCGTAPIVKSLYEFEPNFNKLKITISDIQTLAFHYACLRFSHLNNVKSLLLDYKNDFQVVTQEKFDVIFCITVFEHLQNPLETIKKFYHLLNDNGLLFFDYIKGNGEGLDTQKAVIERDDVINYIKNNFKILSGEVSKEKSIGLCLCEKKAVKSLTK